MSRKKGAGERERREPPLDALQWQTGVRVVTHPLMLAGYAKIFGLSAILMGVFLSFLMLVTGSSDALPAMWMVSAGVSAALFVLGLLGMLLIYGNRMRMRFRLDETGARAEIVDRRSTAVSAAAIMLGLLARRPSVVGAGLISAADTERATAWRGVVSARFHPHGHAIALRNSWRTLVILFCTPENYGAVAAFVEAAMARRPARAAARVNPLPWLFLHTMLIVVAMLPFFLLDHPLRVELFAAIFTLCFALASLWLIPHLALASFLGLAVMAFELIASMLAQRRSMFRPGEVYRAFEVMSGDDWMHLALCILGAAYLVWLSVGLMRGRIVSGLAGDMLQTEDDEPA